MKAESSGLKIWLEDVKPRLDKGASVAEIAADLGVDPSHLETMISEWSTPYATLDGPGLYAEVRDAITRHYYMEAPWHYAIASLFVLQAYLTDVLPVVFYLFATGMFGSGKTNFLSLMSKLTDGVLFENVSVTALARTTKAGKTVCIDEYDVARGKDVDEVRDALVRQGYKAGAAPYVRWDAAKKAPDVIPLYGPKLVAFRGGVDAALQSRGFTLPSVRPKGEDGFEYVLRNLWPDVGDLPARLKTWGESARLPFPPERLQEIAESDAFRAKVRAVVPELGANRDCELGTVALLTAEIAGVDVLTDLREASEMREAVTGAEDSGDLEELREIVLELGHAAGAKALEESPEVTLRQKDIKDAMNRRRKDRGERTLSDRHFARLRQEIGVQDGWIRNRSNKIFWRLPEAWLRGMANPPNLTNLQSLGSDVSQVSQVSQGVREDGGNELLGLIEGYRPCDTCGHESRYKVRAGIVLKAACDPCLSKYGLAPPGGPP